MTRKTTLTFVSTLMVALCLVFCAGCTPLRSSSTSSDTSASGVTGADLPENIDIANETSQEQGEQQDANENASDTNESSSTPNTADTSGDASDTPDTPDTPDSTSAEASNTSTISEDLENLEDDVQQITVEPSNSTTQNRVNTSQLPDGSFIYDASIASLANADPYMDGETVQVTGEVVGDRVGVEDEPDMCWITLQANDNSFAEVTVYMSKESSKSIDTYGSYGKTGTTLQVRGTFNLACKDHTGLSDLHATNVTIVNEGTVTKPGFSIANATPGGILIFVGIALLVAYRKLREREL